MQEINEGLAGYKPK